MTNKTGLLVLFIWF